MIEFFFCSRHYSGIIPFCNNGLTWKSHIQSVFKKITPIIFALKKARKSLNESAAWAIYNSYIYPHLIYMLPVWGSANNISIRPLQILQNKVFKFIKKLPMLFPTIELYCLKNLPLSCLYEFETLVFVYKIKNNLLKCNITLQKVSEIHNYLTRQKDNLYIGTTSRTNRAFYNVFQYGLKIFNDISIDIRNSKLSIFKHRVRTLLISKFREPSFSAQP